MAKLTFLGRGGSVTGSRYLVEGGGQAVAGGLRMEFFKAHKSWAGPALQAASRSTPKTIGLSRAHARAPGPHRMAGRWLAKSGYRGPIFANPATIELTTHPAEGLSSFASKRTSLHAIIHKDSRHANPEPLYTPEDVDPTLKLIKSMPRSGSFDISPEFRVTSYDAGHILRIFEPGISHHRKRQENVCSVLR